MNFMVDFIMQNLLSKDVLYAPLKVLMAVCAAPCYQVADVTFVLILLLAAKCSHACGGHGSCRHSHTPDHGSMHADTSCRQAVQIAKLHAGITPLP